MSPNISRYTRSGWRGTLILPGYLLQSSMRSEKWGYIQIILLLISLSAPALALTDQGHYSPSLIIPTKFRFLLLDMADSPEEKNPPADLVVQADSEKAPGEERAIQDEDLEAALSDIAPEPSYSGMGRGYVETHFDVSFEEPGRKIDNRERLTARGLFDVHVSHGFSS